MGDISYEDATEVARLRGILEARAILRGDSLENMRRVNEMIRRDLAPPAPPSMHPQEGDSE